MKHNLLVQLDCVLDTRLAVLGSYDPTIPERILATPEAYKNYRTRLIDDFSEYGLPRGQFKALWAKRDLTHLRAAMITPFAFELSDISEQIIDQSKAAPHTVSSHDIVINHYPYTDLSDVEKEALGAAILARFKTPVNINFICEPLEVLSPTYWDVNKIATAIMYDFEEWLVAHFGVDQQDKLEGYEFPQNSFYAPALVTDLDKLKEAADFENPYGRRADPLESLQFWFKPYFHLEFLGVEHFSIVEPEVFVSMEMRVNQVISN